MNNEEIVLEFLNDYFEDELNEEISEDDISDAIYSLNHLCDIINEHFGLYEGEDDEMMDFSSSAYAASYNSAKSKNQRRQWRVGKEGRRGAHLSKMDSED